MDLRVLRYAVTVADEGSVVGAAAALHTTQPSLSRQIRALEQELGFDLFVRGAGSLVPTRGGRRFLARATRLLEHSAALEREAQAIAEGRLVDLVVAASPTTLTDVVAPFMATLTDEDPWPQVRPTPAASVFARLSEVDLAVGGHTPPPAAASLVIAELPLLAHVPANHPWAGRRAVSLGDLTTVPVLLPAPGSYTRRELDEAWHRAGLRPETTHEVDSPEVAMALAASGRGVALVSDDPRYGLHALDIVGPDGPVTFTLEAAWEATHPAADSLRAIATRLSAFCADKYGPRHTAEHAPDSVAAS